SCTRTLFLKKRNWDPPPTQPPGFVVPVAEMSRLSPAATNWSQVPPAPQSTSALHNLPGVGPPTQVTWAMVVLTMKPLSPWVLSHALVGQVPLATGLISA